MGYRENMQLSFSQFGIKSLVLVVATVFAVTGCTQNERVANWQHASKTTEEQSRDAGACRAYARRQLELNAGLATDTNRLGSMPGGGASYNEQVRSYDLGRLRDREYAHCMRRLGYTPQR